MRTAWGYDVEESLEPIISVAEFHDMTGLGFSQNPRAEAAIIAASQVVRNYCGWHITPSVDCTAYPAGGTPVLRLPAGYVSAISKVSENGIEIDSTEYEWKRSGLIRRKCRPWSDSWDGIEVDYTAGYSPDAVPDLAEAVCSIASGILSVAPGVIQESADGVSISYSSSASSIAAALTSQQKSALDPYRVVSSHAT